MAHKKHIIKEIATKAAVAAFWLLVWYFLYLLVNNRYYLPSPIASFLALTDLITVADFWYNILLSLLRILAGLVIGCACGVLLSFLTYRFNAVYRLFKPILTLAKTVPVVSFIMLLWLAFFRHKGVMPILISALMVFPIVWSDMTNGHRSLDQKLWEMANCYASPKDAFLFVRLPHIFPYFISGLSTSVGLAWKAGIAAEVLCRPDQSIGREIYTAKEYLESEKLFAWTAVVVILSILLETILVRLFKKIKIRPHVRPSENVSYNGRSYALIFDRINKKYDGKIVLNRFTHTFQNGKVTAILGPSGCGKTTLLSIAAGILKDDDYIYEMPPTAPAIIFQENRLIPTLTVRENILFANRGANINRILKSLSLLDDAEKYPDELSGGMQRRVAIGRAMAFGGGIGIFDEPFSGLDEDTKALCAQALFAAYRDKTVLFVTHDPEDAERYGDFILKM